MDSLDDFDLIISTTFGYYAFPPDDIIYDVQDLCSPDVADAMVFESPLIVFDICERLNVGNKMAFAHPMILSAGCSPVVIHPDLYEKYFALDETDGLSGLDFDLTDLPKN